MTEYFIYNNEKILNSTFVSNNEDYKYSFLDNNNKNEKLLNSTVISNNEDYKYSFLDKNNNNNKNENYKYSFLDILKGGDEIEYIEIEKEDLKNFLTEKQMEDIETILYDKKLKSFFPTNHDIRINENGKIEISIKPVNDLNIKEDIFI